MFKEHTKITHGFVTQTYITLPNGTMICQRQEFIAGDTFEYEDMDGQHTTVNPNNEVYCPFDMKQPKQIPDDKDAVKFVCPGCGDNRLEAVMDGSHTTIIEGMFKGGSMEYGDTESCGDLERFQCVSCGQPIEHFEDEPITDDEEVVEWCKANCVQK